MRAGWQIKRLGEVCEIIKGRKPILKATASDGYLPYLVAKVMRGSAEAEYASVKDRNAVTVMESETIIICDGSNSGEVFTGFHGVLSSTMGKIAKKAEINDAYLRAFLTSTFDVFNGAKTGSAIPHLDKEAMYQLEFPLPPLPEQKRIVGILDEAFEGIATAKANAEKNLQNARALFESHLQSVFTQRGEGWVEKNFDEICVLQRGFDLPTHSRKEGIFPLVSSNGITDRINTWKVKAPGVVTGRSGTIGNIHYIEEDYWPLNTALYIKDFHGNYERYIYYFLKQFDLSKYSSGAGVPTLNRNNVHSVKVWFPKDTTEQKSIASKLDALSEETQRLESIYQQKLDALEELKKSLLNQAFTGEL